MFLALKEMARAKIRFGLLMAAVGLLVFLILFQQTLQNGLLNAIVGGIEAQSAPVLVYSVDGRRTLQGSVITPDLEAAVVAVDEVGRLGHVGVGTFSVTIDDQLGSVTLVGAADPTLGAPTELSEGRAAQASGEVVVSATGGDTALQVGDRVRVQPGGLELEVVGVTPDAPLFATTTLYATWDTYAESVAAANPDAGDPLPSVLGLEPASGVSAEQLATAVNDAVPDADALTRSQASAQTPGVAQIRSSFQVIFLLYGLVAPFVTGLFFLIVTFQKAGSLTLLRAIGAPSRRLVSALLVQVVAVVGIGYALGVALYAPMARGTVGGVPLRFETAAVALWAVLLLVLGMLSALVAAKRVLAIDPVAATHGQGLGS
jgi:putative ABC transport system permease protein